MGAVAGGWLMTSVANVGAAAVDGSTGRVSTKAARRRLVAYSSLADLWQDLDKIEKAHKAGTLRRMGNHEAGPNFAHLAMGMKGSFEGYPTRAPWMLRVVGGVMKKRILSKPFEPGFNLSKDAESKAWDDSVSFEGGLAMLREQVTRAGKAGAAPGMPHPFFGAMTAAEWQVYYLRHAELHLSFLQL